MLKQNEDEKGVPPVSGDKAKEAAGPGLDSQLQAQIGRKLKGMYDSYLNEPIPDHLVSLLEKLDAKSRSVSADDGGKGNE